VNQALADAEQIETKINGRFRRCQTGDAAPLKEAFHPHARMFGAVGEDRCDGALDFCLVVGSRRPGTGLFATAVPF